MASQFRPDGGAFVGLEQVAVQGQVATNHLIVWSLPTLEMSSEVAPAEGAPDMLAFMWGRDGKRLATSTSKQVDLWSADGKTYVGSARAPDLNLGWDISADGHYLSAVGARGRAVIVDASNGAELMSVMLHTEKTTSPGHTNWNRDSSVAVFEADGALRLWSANGLRSAHTAPRKGPVQYVYFVGDGRFFIIGDESGRIELWSTPDLRLAKVLDPGKGAPWSKDKPPGRFTDLTFLTKEDRFLTMHADRSVRLWELSNLGAPRMLGEAREGRGGDVPPKIDVSGDGGFTTWVCDNDWSVQVADLRHVSPSRALPSPFLRNGLSPTGVALTLFSQQGHILAVWRAGTLEVWDAEATSLLLSRVVEPGTATGQLAFSKDGRFLALSVGDIYFLRIRDGATLVLRTVGALSNRRTLTMLDATSFAGPMELAEEEIDYADGSRPTNLELNKLRDPELLQRFFASP